ncbi:hypothetical protein CEXT_707811 [Caerostris extrusa]|uniref:Transposase n=1 Tax=Caerostris extrusa TaxID=172846 RepID=A0AAV4W2P6_CAEEX|nr:hypothetical protein CEXT_707811 [Caerostris extrusa]
MVSSSHFTLEELKSSFPVKLIRSIYSPGTCPEIFKSVHLTGKRACRQYFWAARDSHQAKPNKGLCVYFDDGFDKSIGQNALP